MVRYSPKGPLNLVVKPCKDEPKTRREIPEENARLAAQNNSKKPNAKSQKVFDSVSSECVLVLACTDCAVDSVDLSQRTCHTGCREDVLIGCTMTDTRLRSVRKVPRDYDVKRALCRKRRQCQRGKVCEYPHSDVEKRVWCACFAQSWSVEKFRQDLKKLNVEKCLNDVISSSDCALELVCLLCLTSDTPACTPKQNHSPHCKQGHRWTEKKTTLILQTSGAARGYIQVDSHEVLQDCDASALAKQFKALRLNGFTNKDIMDRYKALKQREKSREENNKKIIQKHVRMAPSSHRPIRRACAVAPPSSMTATLMTSWTEVMSTPRKNWMTMTMMMVT